MLASALNADCMAPTAVIVYRSRLAAEESCTQRMLVCSAGGFGFQAVTLDGLMGTEGMTIWCGNIIAIGCRPAGSLQLRTTVSTMGSAAGSLSAVLCARWASPPAPRLQRGPLSGWNLPSPRSMGCHPGLDVRQARPRNGLLVGFGQASS